MKYFERKMLFLAHFLGLATVCSGTTGLAGLAGLGERADYRVEGPARPRAR